MTRRYQQDSLLDVRLRVMMEMRGERLNSDGRYDLA